MFKKRWTINSVTVFNGKPLVLPTKFRLRTQTKAERIAEKLNMLGYGHDPIIRFYPVRVEG